MTEQLDKFLIKQGLRPMGTLAHWGIKGMRWGVTRSDYEISTSSDAVRAANTSAAIQKGGVSTASDSDLSQLVNRLNLEKRYSEIETSTIDKGHSTVKKILSFGNTMNDAIRFSNSEAGKMLSSTLRSKTSSVGKHRA